MKNGQYSNLYDRESLQLLYDLHDHGYRIDDRDVEKVNRMITSIREARMAAGTIRPVAGDIIGYTTRGGDYYGQAHIERMANGGMVICLAPDIPFCHETPAGVAYDTHGETWSTLETTGLEPAGVSFKEFRTWGQGGRNAHGAVYFHAPVRVWNYAEPEPLFGGYTTRHWAKYPIGRYPDPERKGEFTYRSDGFTLYSREELKQLTGILHGKLFNGFYRNSLILWGYRMRWEELPEEEWNTLEAEIHLSFLGVSPVRIETDPANHTVIIYKKSNRYGTI